MAYLKSLPSIYSSSRSVGDVLEGTDTAIALIEPSCSGDLATLQSLLSHPDGIKLALGSPHRIYYEHRSMSGNENIRPVSAMPILNLVFALEKAAHNGQVAVVSTFLSFASQHGIDPSTLITRPLVTRIIKKGDIEVFKAFVTADHQVINYHLLHGDYPLERAVRSGQADIVAFILQHGADLKLSSQRSYGYSGSLLSVAARADDVRITELLLKHGVTPARSGGLHSAAERGAIDVMRVLIQRGVDVNEQLPEAFITPAHDTILASWTPMHFTASKDQVQAMELLESHGARSDIEDRDGRIPKQLRKNV